MIPKRESLRRVLELSKRTFEDQNHEKDTGNTTGSQSDTSDAESDPGKNFYRWPHIRFKSIFQIQSQKKTKNLPQMNRIMKHRK